MLRRLIYITILLSIALPLQAAKFAGDPFSLGVGGRALAMGGSVMAGPFDGSSAYWNPAGMSALSGRYITAMHAETFGSLINHDFISYVDARSDGNNLIDAFGFYFYYLGGGGIKITQRTALDYPTVVREESHGDFLFAASLSRKASARLSLGLTARVIYRDIGTESGYGLSVDAGATYLVSNKINLGMMVTDITTGFIRFSGDTFESGSNTETIYPTVKPGIMISHTVSDFTVRLVGSGDVKFESIKSAAQYWLGAISLDTHFGSELSWREMLFARAGFDIGRFTSGGGILIRDISIDFAYSDHDDLDNTYRISAGYRF